MTSLNCIPLVFAGQNYNNSALVGRHNELKRNFAPINLKKCVKVEKRVESMRHSDRLIRSWSTFLIPSDTFIIYKCVADLLLGL